MGKKLTLYSLARAAKVSAATVSRIVAGNPSVDPAIRSQVLKVAQKLGIDLEQRRKGKTKSRTIAFLLANRDVLHNFQARVLFGAEGYCSERNWEMLFMSYRYSPDIAPELLHLPQVLSPQNNARAVILGGTNYLNLLTALKSRGIPFAVLGQNVSGDWDPDTCDAAYADDIAGSCEATRHLLAHGHRAIGFIGNLQFPWFRRCSIGYLRAMKDAGLKPLCVDIRSDGMQLGYLAMKSLLSNPPWPTAIFAGTDQVAAGVYTAMRESHLSIPEDISVMGFNDTQGDLMSPPLSSVREFPEELGRHLAEFVLNRLEHPSVRHQQIVIPCQLVPRNSVARPKAVASTS